MSMSETQLGQLKQSPKTSTLYGKCDVCKADFVWPEDDSIHFARIQRGYFSMADEGGIEENNIKAEFWICKTCYLENPLLCAFFNSIGLRGR
jgi:hypothetical protein